MRENQGKEQSLSLGKGRPVPMLSNQLLYRSEISFKLRHSTRLGKEEDISNFGELPNSFGGVTEMEA
jgi:hypothetical protein